MARRFLKKHGNSKDLSKQNNDSDQGRDCIILFVDVVGCSEISNHLSQKDYCNFIEAFHDCFNKVCNYYKDSVYEDHERKFFHAHPRGDEGCLKIFAAKNEKELARDVDIAISIALDLKKMWLFTKYNRIRVRNEKLLPVELAIGIHLGKVWLKDDGNPEGYTINLAKRIESASRDGKFTHIFVSETARERLYTIRDDSAYKCTKAFSIGTKGISHDINVHEIKHHFLVADWQYVVESEPWEISMVYPELDGSDILEIAKSAYEINPTNLWLAEEYLIITLMDAFIKASKVKKEEDIEYLETIGYGRALELAHHIAITHRDGTTLSNVGLILGDLGRYKEEEEYYRDAIRLEESDADFHWYLGDCLSYIIASEMESNKQSLDEFYKKNNTKVNEILESYRKAGYLNPINPWIRYSYACELSNWSQANLELKEEAISQLIHALSADNDTIKAWALEEEYLKHIIDDPRIKKCLGSQ